MADAWIEKALSARKLQKPGGEIYRSFGPSMKREKADKLIEEAHRRGFGHREMHEKLYIYHKG